MRRWGESSPCGHRCPQRLFVDPNEFRNFGVARALLQWPLMSTGKRYLVYIPVGLVLSGFLVGCSVDGGDGNDDEGRTDVVRIPSDDPAENERLDALDIICESSLTITGTFTESTPPPADVLNCWGIGTWSVTATLDRVGCDPQLAVPAGLVYEAVRDDDDNTGVRYVTDPTDNRVNLKLSANGDGCIGHFEHFGTDDSVWSFEVYLQEDNATLSGTGTYAVYKFDTYPGE